VRYKLLTGQSLDLSALPRGDVQFLLDLMRRALEDEDYFELERRVCGVGAHPLKGSPRVTREIHDTALFRAAEDVVDRVGIRQGVLAPDPGDARMPVEDIVSVTEAAKSLGITRSAVVKAAHAGRIKGKKIGHTWALLRGSVNSYKVARYRVEAGRAAHRTRRRRGARSRARERAS
jgi:excisionase family DNA binding protein